jgi:hypothetical protein
MSQCVTSADLQLEIALERSFCASILGLWQPCSAITLSILFGLIELVANRFEEMLLSGLTREAKEYAYSRA